MRNVVKIASEDFKKLFSNAISILIVIGLICIPSMYTWFNIAGSWDPYKNTASLKVAIVNNDKGYTNEYLPMEINIGSTLTGNLHENNSFEWVFTDEETALNGVSNGSYYAAIVLPDNFSEDIMSLLADKTENATLYYYSNDKANPIAPKITSKGADVVQQQINSLFSEKIYTALFKIALNLSNFLTQDSVKQVFNRFSTTLESVSSSLDTAALQIEGARSLIDSVCVLIDDGYDLLPSKGSEKEQKIKSVISTLTQRMDDAESILYQVRNALIEAGVSETTIQVVDDMISLVKTIRSSISSSNLIVDDFVSTTQSLKVTLLSSLDLLDSLDGNLTSVKEDISNISGDLKSAKTALDKLLGSNTLEQVKEVIGDSPAGLANLISRPVELNRNVMFPIANNGSAMASFYTSLSIWVGATILCAIMKTSVSEKRIKKMNKNKDKKHQVKNWQLYLGRYIVFATMALAQSTLIALGEIFFLQIQCVHPFLYVFTCWIIALVYSLLIYTLAISFGNIGKALAVIILVLQVAAAGGMFPPEMLREPFSTAYDFLPATFSIYALRYCIAGFSWVYYYIFFLCVLVVFYVPISLILGLVLRNPIIKSNEWIKRKTSETKLM